MPVFVAMVEDPYGRRSHVTHTASSLEEAENHFGEKYPYPAWDVFDVRPVDDRDA